jgi:DNA mismatch repair ATPase MutS
MSTLESLGLQNSDQAFGYIVAELKRLHDELVERRESLRRLEDAWRTHDRQEMQRVHTLEERFAALEARQITKDDVEKIWKALDTLGKADAAETGGRRFIRELAPWLAVLIAGLALLGVGQNRRIVDQRLPPAPVHQER